ncbi:MAG: flagellar assembly protein FliW [Defluviitaleaceae bacterium]|nr:flagellar assembly protein FliW [Defluviitaleaceae bacterium]MCL2263991.1 flagellar assembly protein FliW [Defluviitaleaceae bacterium]
MEKLQTRHFGEVTYDLDRVITFEDGIPGFPDSKRYMLMSETEDEDTFFWLQSVDEGDVAFTLMDVYKVLPDYDPQVDRFEVDELGPLAETPLLIYNIVVIPDYVRQMRVNLRAPVVINLNTGLGKQMICTNDDYSIRFMIFEELERAKKKLATDKNAGSNS